ncbi:MAG: Hpt domain-containing protein [Gemmatimonadota bacterium]
MTEQSVLDGAALDRLRRLGGDTLVRRLIESFLAHGAERLDALGRGAVLGDAGLVERAAHTLKSSAGYLGATLLQQECALTEAQAHDGTIDHAAAARILAEYQRATTELRRILEETS